MDKLINWHREFYRQREFEPNDTVPLYKLRATSDEFDALSFVLNDFVEEKAPFMSVNSVIERFPLFNKLFVLYAAEWWKRKYSGGHWTWKHIIDGLGINEDDISPQKRSMCVSRGLSGWNLKIADTSGKRFLGAIAIQGGLPVHFLTTQEGNIYKVLEKLVKHAEGVEVSVSRLEAWAEELYYFLPNTYQKKEIYALLAQVIDVLFNIKRSASGQTNKAVLHEWRTNHKIWLSELPITARYEEVDRLISRLLGVVANTNAKDRISGNFLSIRRNLLINYDGEIKYNGFIEIASSVTTDELNLKFNGILSQNPPMSLNLQISTDSSNESLTLHRVIGDEKYNSSIKSIQITDQAFFDQIVYELQTPDGAQSAITDKKGEAIVPDHPILFELAPDSSDEYEYIGQGSKSTKSEKMLMLLAPEADVDAEHAKVLGLFEGYKAVIIKSRAIVIQHGNKYQMRVSSTLNEEFYIVGNRVDWVSERSTQIYRGMPTVFVKKNGSEKKINSNLKYRVGRDEIYSTKNFIGLIQLIYEENGNHLWSQKIIVIGKNSREEFSFSDTTVKFEAWGNFNITCNDEVVSLSKYRTEGNHWKYDLTGISYPAHANTRFSWSIKDGGAKIELPIPYKGIQLLNSKDEKVLPDSLIALNKLHGYILRVYPGDEKFFQVLFELSSNQSIRQQYKIDVRLSDEEKFRVFRLNDFKSKFQELLSLTSGVDDQIRITVILRGHRRLRFNIAQYDIQTVTSENGLRLSQQNNASTDDNPVIIAQIIHQPGVQQVEIPVLSDNELDLTKLEKGTPWLVYPSKESQVNTRPAFWSGTDAVSVALDDLSELSKAMVISDKEERCAAIAAVLVTMSQDLESDSWDTFNGLVSEFGHLPLSALDVWSVAIQNYDFMALLSLGVAKLPPGFIERFASELPFMFYFIPVSALENAFKLTLEKVHNSLLYNVPLFMQVLEKQMALEVWTKNEITNLISIACKYRFNINNLDIDKASPKILRYLIDTNFEKLKNIQCDADWPDDKILLGLINKQIRIGQELFENQRKMSLVYNLPVLLGCHVMYPDEIRIKFTPNVVSVIREVKRFDQNWFSNMFNYTIAWNYLKDKNL